MTKEDRKLLESAKALPPAKWERIYTMIEKASTKYVQNQLCDIMNEKYEQRNTKQSS